MKNLVKKTEKQLFKYIARKFKDAIVADEEYILVQGDLPILLVAHLDTVHQEPVRVICESRDKNILMSPQGIGGDDRCGVYALLKVWESVEKKPSLLFTCQEEVGGLGAYSFSEDYEAGLLPSFVDNFHFIIEIDRKGNKQAVYYDCDNKSFKRIFTKLGFNEEFGSFSDISVIAPSLNISAVNLSAGYENAHTCHEYINMEWLNYTIQAVISICENPTKRYIYIKSKYSYDSFFKRGRKYKYLTNASWWDYEDELDYLK